MKQLLSLLFLLWVVGGAVAQTPLKPVAVTASTYLKGAKVSYEPKNVADDDLQTWWSPAAEAAEAPTGSGSWLELTLLHDMSDEMAVITHVDIHPGSHYPSYPGYGDLFRKNLRLHKARLVFSGEFALSSEEIIYLRDSDEVQRIELSRPHFAKSVRLIPLETYPSEKWNDLCISHFQALGHLEPYTGGGGVAGGYLDIADAVGVYAHPSDPCNESRIFVFLDKEGTPQFSQVYLMDAEAGQISFASFTTYDDGTLLSIDYYTNSEQTDSKTVELGLLKNWVQVAEEPLLEKMRIGSASWEEMDAAYTHFLYQNFYVGEYLVAEDWPLTLTEDGRFYTQESNYRVQLVQPAVSNGCGELILRDENGQLLSLGIMYNGKGYLSLHELECDEEGPGCWLKKEPLYVLKPRN